MKSSLRFWIGLRRPLKMKRSIPCWLPVMCSIPARPATGRRSSTIVSCAVWAASCCRHVVVVAGNHDSPSFLNAPKELLRALNVYVVGSMTEALEDEVFVLHADDKPEAIVCAVPYLRDKDIRTVEPGETIDDKNAKLVEGLKKPLRRCLRHC